MNPHDLPAVDVAEAARAIDPATAAPHPLIVDVREPNELVSARVPGAVSLPLSRFIGGFRSLPHDRTLLMLCRSGNRSASATEYLLRNGFPDVRNIRGGIVAWHGAGLPLTAGPLEPGEGELPGAAAPAVPSGS
jgi:rhodanese-related sulfurtransferase